MCRKIDIGGIYKDYICLFYCIKERRKMRIEEISIDSKKYPQKLRNVYNPPLKLYVLGNKKILNNKGIAIVGTRDCTKYGKNISFKFSKELTQKGFNIISGLALGIDTYAHLGNVQINMENSKSIGKTIAVLGCGIDELYPKQNKILAKQILKTGGCIISEYPNGTKPNKANFPQRNRIISGLAESIIVVEAGERSGAIITANLALEQGKEIFAVPGDITKKQSIGTNKLIKDGAFVITEVNDILNNNV